MTNYPYEMQLVVDPSNPRNVVAAGSISIYDSADTGHTTLLALTDPNGVPITNPITSNANGFTEPFVTTSPQVLWVSGEYVDYFSSFVGLRDEAVAAKTAAEEAAATAGADAAAVATAAIGTATDDATAAAASAATAASNASASATAAANSAALVGAPADSAIAAVVNNGASATKAALNATYGEQISTVASPARAAVEKLRIAPSLAPLTERMEPLRRVVIQTATAIYATYTRVGETPSFQKSTDAGKTWTIKSTLPAFTSVIALLKSGTLIAIEETATTTPGGSNPRLWRSTDDGANWVLTTAGLKFPPLSPQGVCEGADGSVMVGEYGNVAPHQYRVMRSTDDGVTWAATFTSAGTEPAGDPGHIHSVTYDTVAAKHVIFVDRPIVEGVSGPIIYSSTNNGATWTVVGEANSINKPNFVAPMYFSEYIAWGSDNQINGRISRMTRADFYAGNFDEVETVAMLSQKAFYFVFPIRPDVWAITMAGEFIPGAQTGGPGSTMNEVWLVSNNGSLVSGGMESYALLTDPGTLSGVRAQLPSRIFDQTDHLGLLWANMPVSRPGTYAAVPATQGWEPPSKRIDFRAMPYLPPRVPFYLNKGSDPADSIRFMEYIPGQYISMTSDVAALGSRSEVRFLDDGSMAFLNNGVTVATMATGQFKVPQRMDFATNGVGIRAGSGSPEGVVTAPGGTIYLNWAGGRAVSAWVKESGSGTTGWMPIGQTSGPTTSRPATPVKGMNMFDETLGKPIWYTGLAWVDATGAAV